jgi:hypothetical protein
VLDSSCLRVAQRFATGSRLHNITTNLNLNR